jgi:hypothetical protein
MRARVPSTSSCVNIRQPLLLVTVAQVLVLFPPVHREGSGPRAGVLRTGIVAGVLSASAILGALVVYAYRDGTPLFDPDLGPPIGALVHFGICVVWGVAFSIVAAPWRGWRVLAVAFVISAIAWAITPTILPASLRLGNGLYASTPRAAVVHTLMAAGLLLGMRLARR